MNKNINSNLITKRQLGILRDYRMLCFFPNAKEKEGFERQVSSASGCTKFSEIKKSDFKSAQAIAKSILHKRGEAVYKPQNDFKKVQHEDEQTERTYDDIQF